MDADRLDADVVARERSVLAEKARASGKPDSIIGKMVEGGIRKFYEEAALLKQAFVIDPERSVEKMLADAGKEVGGAINVTDFVCFRLGEGIDRDGGADS
jgi:elongation factor Ts